MRQKGLFVAWEEDGHEMFASGLRTRRERMLIEITTASVKSMKIIERSVSLPTSYSNSRVTCIHRWPKKTKLKTDKSFKKCEKETVFKDDSGVFLYLFFPFSDDEERKQRQVLNFRCQDKEERKELLQKEMMMRIEKLFVFRLTVFM